MHWMAVGTMWSFVSVGVTGALDGGGYYKALVFLAQTSGCAIVLYE